MFRRSTGVGLAVALTLAGAGPGGAADLHEDPLGDAIGAAPDIVAVTIEDSEDMPVLAISVEFATEPPLGTDGATWTDTVFIGLVADPETDAAGQPVSRVAVVDTETDYVIGTHGVTLASDLETGGMLLVHEGEGSLYWHVVDVAVDGPTVTWSLDRKLIGDPAAVALQVLVGVEREDATEAEYDVFPDEGEPLALYTFTAPAR